MFLLQYFNFRNVLTPALSLLLCCHLAHANNHGTLAMTIYPDITEGTIGSYSPEIPDDPSDNMFQFQLEKLPRSDQEAIVVFELLGVADRSSIGISMNDEQATGGQLIVLHDSWTCQRFIINPASLKRGINVLRFTAPYHGGLQYRVRNVRIEILDTYGHTDARAFHVDQNIFYENGGVVSGFLKGKDATCAQILINNIPVENLDATFERYWTAYQSTESTMILSALFPDGEMIEQCISITPNGCADVVAIQSNRGKRSAHVISADAQWEIRFISAGLDIPEQAVPEQKHITITALRPVDLMALQAGVYNATAMTEGYRCLPHGSKFNKEILLSLAYDPARIPDGYTEEDLRIFYFDEQSRKWETLRGGVIHAHCKTITAPTDHFTDFIAGVIHVPETPESESFLPTVMSGIPHASPIAGIDFIAPPTANAMGTARTELSISIPEGRNGMAPELAVIYNSEGGNGWCGLGWDVELPRISVDTRWGVPRYLPDLESETYLFDGRQLGAVSHRGPLQQRTTEKQFYPRVAGAFNRIIRHGSNPKNYWWEVTGKDGVRRFFGGRPSDGVVQAAVLKDASGNIAQWCLVEERDLQDNFVSYTYRIVEDPGVTGSSTPGFQIYPEEILYTGHGETNGPYRIRFTRDRELNESRRPDVGISARMGFKQVSADLLRKIEVQLHDTQIRTYEFQYQTGAFFKTLLRDILVLDEEGAEFYRHSMEYHDDVRTGESYVAFTSEESWDTPADNIRGDLLSGNPLFPNETSVLGGSSTTDWTIGGAVTVGPLGNLAAKTNTAGGNFTYGSASGQGLIAFVDINGDGLPDKVYHKNNKLFYRPNLTGQGGTTAFGEERAIQGVNQFSLSKTDSYAIGVEAHPGFAFVGYTNTTVNTAVSTYFSDFNGDGLIDIVFEGKIYFNHINSNGDPVFTLNSGDTPSPIEIGAGIDDDLFTLDPDELEEKIDAFPLHDVVRMWEAPYDGQIRITGPVRLLEDTSPASQVYDKKDGVRVAIQVRGTERWSAMIEADDFTDKVPQNVGTVNVNKGDRVYFRVQSRFDGAYDQVYWDPVIAYLAQPLDALDANGKRIHEFTASEDFLLASGQVVSMPVNGTIRLDGLFEKPVTSDDVRVYARKLSGAGTQVLFDSTFAWDSVIVHNILVDDISVTQNDEIILQVMSKTQVEWPAIKWIPALIYTAADDGSEVTAPDGTPLIAHCPAPEYRMYNDPLQKTIPWIAPEGGTLMVTELLNFNGSPNGSLSMSLKGVQRLFAIEQVVVVNGITSLPSPIEIEIFAGDTLYFEYHTTDRDFALDVVTAETVVTLSGNTINVGAGLHTVRDEDDIIFGPMYRGWGQFVYNGNRDRAEQPIQESELMIDESIADGTGDIEDIEDPDDISNPFTAASEPFIVMISDPKNRYWVGSDDHTYIRRDTMSSSRLGEKDLLPPAFTSDGTTHIAPAIMSRSYINSVAGGVSAGPVGAGGSVAFNTTENLLDVLDLNGDGYPDIVTPEMVQYTNMRGGLEEKATPHLLEGHRAESFAYGISTGGGYVYSSATNTGNESRSAPSAGSRGSMRSVSSTGSAASARSQRSGSVKSNVSRAGKKANDASRASKSSAGIDGGFTVDNDSTAQTWMDINGDGLPDMIFNDGTVALNLGYSFAEREQWGFPVIHEGESRDYGGGLGVNLFNGSIVAGVSINRTDNFSDKGLIDLNGDGLVDLVTGVDPLRVRLNTGSGFAPEVVWGGAEYFEQGTATGESVNAAFTVCVPIVIFGIRICVNPSSSTGRGVSRFTRQIGDADGDGFPDLLRSNNDGEFFVRRSAIGQTNLLKTIHRPLGATINLNYAVEGNTYDLPYGRWVLSEVEVYDGVDGDGADIRKTAFTYADGRHERHEREFYGFGTVEIHELDTENDDALYRTTAYQYHTGDYYTRGLIVSETVRDAGGNAYYALRNRYVLRNVLTGQPLPPGAAQDDAGMAFPALQETSILYYERHPEPGLQTSMHYEYDQYGNIIRYTETGDGTDEDEFIAIIGYHDPGGTYLKSIPAKVEVRTEGMRKRYSEQDIDENGNITQIRKYLSGSEIAMSDFAYDPYGNVIRVVKPANAQGQRLTYDISWDDDVRTYPVRVSDGYGYSSSKAYDYRYGALLESIDINKNTIKYTLDEKGRLATITGPYEIASGAPYSLAFEYAPESRPGYAITRRYDAVHQRAIETIHFADGLGREVQTKKPGLIYSADHQQAQAVTLVSGLDIYDAFGRIVASHYPVIETTGFTNYNTTVDVIAPTRVDYDVLDRGTNFTLPDGATTTVVFDILPDNTGNAMLSMTTTDALGNITAEYRDARERVRSEMAIGPNGEIWTNFVYNALSELIRIVDTENHSTEYIYDQLGRRTAIDHPDAGVTSFEFDLAGNLTRKVTDKIRSEISPAGAVEYLYDHERLTGINYPKNYQNKVQLHYGAPDAAFNRAGRIWLREDASGGEEYFYGPQGETLKTIRTLLISQSNVQTYVTEFLFDTWGRVREMRYPDGEVVTFGYNTAGKLNTMQGRKAGIDYSYIGAIGYDKFEEQTFLEYGNGVRTTYSFEPDRRRVQGMQVAAPGGVKFIGTAYSYDAMSNLLSARNDAPGEQGNPGGTSVHHYTYDDLYRVTSATGAWSGTDGRQRSYALDLYYDDLHNILSKEQRVEADGALDALKSYHFNYTYAGPAPHKPTEISGRKMLYDPSGNLVATRGETAFTFSQLIWDEENRLRGVSNNGYISHYTYDAQGERAIKSHGGQQGVFVDGAPAGAIDHLDQYTAYVNPYFTVENDRFVKHYFAGEQKVLSKIGTGKFNFSPLPGAQGITAGDLNYSRRMQLLRQAQDTYYSDLGIPPGPPTLQGYYGQPEYTSNPLTGGTAGMYNNPPPNWPGPPGPPDPDGPPGPPVWFAVPGTRDEIRAGYGFDSTATAIYQELDAFFYHNDHLGSAHYLTDWAGDVRQHTEYLPSGEVFVDQHTSSETHPYKFNGKELDAETGYYYYGARYYDPRFSMWNSVDPLTEQFPAWSPYAYTFHNPLRFRDPDGRAPGDLFSSPTKAAKDFAMQFNPPSIADNVEYGATIYTMTMAGKPYYTYSPPARSTEEDAVTPSTAPSGFRVVADVHTHSAWSPQFDNDHFSPADIADNTNQGIVGYVATPAGKLLKYDPATQTTTVVSKSIPFDKNHPGHRMKKGTGSRKAPKTHARSNAVFMRGKSESRY